MKVSTRLLSLFICLCCLVPCTGCSAPDKKTHEKNYYTFFDTVSYVYSYANDTADEFKKNTSDICNILEEYHQLLDIYQDYPDIKNLYTVNKNAGICPTSVDKKLIDFMLYAKDMYELTDGTVNVMMGSVLSLWQNGKNNNSVPSDKQLMEANKYTDFSLLEIDEKNNTLYIKDANASIDVGAIGKGYAAEMAANFLEQKNVTGYVLNIGGNIRIIGTKPSGKGWLTGIKNPNETTEMAAHLDLSDTSCVTSGSYERFYVAGGKKYHHIIDPKTLMPSEFFPSVTVITKHSGLADALSTALFCMSYEKGVSLVNSIDGVDALWITHDGKILYTDGLNDMFSE